MNHVRDKADELEARLVDFAVRIIKLSNSLPKTPAGRHAANQVLRSGTSPAPNYSEARAAESKADFLHKLGIVLKELNETGVWLRIIDRSGLVRMALMANIIDETTQLSKIITASIKTSKSKIK
jgi:four helix bundle protein